MATLMNLMIENIVDGGKYAGRPLEANYTWIGEFLPRGELAVVKRAIEITNAIDDDSGDQMAYDDLWSGLANLIEFAAMAIQMEDEEDADLLERTKAYIMEDLWASIHRVMSEDDINALNV